jgi:aerobic carbon-monoxide dehydrogenase medium subunit
VRPGVFTYDAPASVAEVIDILHRHGPEAKVLAGGQSLVPMMKLRLTALTHIVDIGRVPDLDAISEDNGALVIGAMARHEAIENSPLVRARCPLLAEAASHIADPIVRNRGTIGGSLCHADPAADFPLAAIVLGAEMIATGRESSRAIPIDRFFTGFLTTALKPDELLTAVKIPKAPAKCGGAHLKLSRRTNGLAIVGAAAMLALDDGGNCADVRVALAGMGPTSVRAAAVERALHGKRITQTAIDNAAALAAQDTDPPSDLHGSAEYRRSVAPVIAGRVLKLAAQRAGVSV